MDIFRRRLLQNLGLSLTSSLWLPPLHQVFAQATNLRAESSDLDHFFVMVNPSNHTGLDVTLGLDPRVHAPGEDQKDIFLEYRPEDIIGNDNVKLGPAAESLMPFIDDIAVINGVNMRRDVGEETLINHLRSGFGDKAAAVMPVRLAYELKSGPLGVLTSANIPSGVFPVILSFIQESSSSSSENISLRELVQIINSGDEQPLFKSPYYDKSRQVFLENSETIINFVEKSEELSQGDSQADQFTQAAAAFVTGGSRFASLTLTDLGDLDTHSNHERNHLREQKGVWERMAKLFQVFSEVPYKEGSLFDYTTFAFVCEHSRTPFLNGGLGKDHNVFTNSVLLAGKGVHNVQVGASQVVTRSQSPLGVAKHVGAAINYRTGEVVANFQKGSPLGGVKLIHPENVANTIAAIFGLKPVTPEKKFPIIPGLIKV